MAGLVGVDPGPLTLRQLVWMADGVRRQAWDHTSLLAALLHNQWARRGRAKKPAAFHPYEQKHRGSSRLTPATIGRLKAWLPQLDSHGTR